MESRKRVPGQTAETILTIVSIVIFTAVMIMMLNSQNGIHDLGDPVEITDDWYIIEDGQRVYIDVSQPQKVSNGTFRMYNEVLPVMHSGSMVSTSAAQYALRITQGNDILYQYTEGSFKLNTQMKAALYCDAELHDSASGSVVLFEYTGIEGSTFDLPVIMAGSARDIFWDHIKNEIETFAWVLILIFLSIVVICTYIYLRIQRMNERRLIDAALFMLLCAIWFITNSPVTIQLCAMPDVIYQISYFMFMLFGVPMCSFILNTPGMHKYISVYISMMLFYVNLIVQNVLVFAFDMAFSDMLIATHILLVAGIAIVVRALMAEAAGRRENTHVHEIHLTLTAFTMLSVCGILALIIYWRYSEVHIEYSMVFRIGIMLFVLFLMACLIVSMVRNLKSRSEAELSLKMSQTDMKTGLPNTEALADDIRTIELTASEYDNIAIIFISLSGMKKLNARYGYQKGDEVVIAAANAVRRLFAESGQCYRMFGDEFCIIIKNPQENEDIWGEKIAAESSYISRTGYYEVSVFWGCSFIRDENGFIKNVENWKYEADQNLQDKRRRADADMDRGNPEQVPEHTL